MSNLSQNVPKCLKMSRNVPFFNLPQRGRTSDNHDTGVCLTDFPQCGQISVIHLCCRKYFTNNPILIPPYVIPNPLTMTFAYGMFVKARVTPLVKKIIPMIMTCIRLSKPCPPCTEASRPIWIFII